MVTSLEDQQLLDLHPYQAGMLFKLFSDEKNQYLHVPSQFVFVTEGSERFRLAQTASVLCRNTTKGFNCPRGNTCHFVHAMVNSAEVDPAFRRIEVHKNDANEIGFLRYDALPTGVMLQIPSAHNEAVTVVVPSHTLYRTKGAEVLYKMYPAAPAPSMSRQFCRCTYYETKKVCHRGIDCMWLHVAYDD